MNADLVRLGGALQLSLLVASGLVPFIFDWRAELAKLTPFLRSLFWVYGAFVVIMIVGFATISIGWSTELASGAPLARAVCAFIAFFWAARLAVQLFVFDVGPYVRHPLIKLGYHGLTLIFAYLVLVFGSLALR